MSRVRTHTCGANFTVAAGVEEELVVCAHFVVDGG